MKKAVDAKEWNEVIKHGLKVMTVNPWDKAAMLAMATAAENMGNVEARVLHLNWARAAAPKDVDILTASAKAAASVGKFDLAIDFWHRVAQARPNDEGPQREIASLAVQKTVKQGKYVTDEDGQIVDSHAKSDEQKRQEEYEEDDELSPEEKIRQKIDADPTNMSGYIELAQFHIHNEDFAKAEDVYADAFEASDGDEDVREHWEDVQMRRLRQQMIQAGKRGEKENAAKLKQDLIVKELDVYKNRCQRNPNNLGFKYDLGFRYQLSGQINEAIKQYQAARNDTRRRGDCMLRLGECFQKIKQNRLSMSHYKMAIEEIPDRDEDAKKRALYLAGKMAEFLKDIDAAEQYMTQLAGMDFTYKDVSDILARISDLRETERGGDDEGPGEIEDAEIEDTEADDGEIEDSDES